MIDNSHICRCEDGSNDIESIDEDEEDEILEVGQVEAHHSGWSFCEALRFSKMGRPQ